MEIRCLDRQIVFVNKGVSVCINRSFLLGDIIVLKKKFQSKMSFIFYINNGFATMASMEQFPGFYQNLSYIPSNTQEFYPSTNFQKTWTQSQLFTQADSVVLNTTLPNKDETLFAQQPPAIASQKPKKKMEKTVEKEILSAKKNSQSNIINQFYSFYGSRQKSEKVVERCAILLGKSLEDCEKILPIFYSTIRFINAKRGRKYVNVGMFLKSFAPEQMGEYLAQMREKVDQLECLSLEQLCEIFRRCTKYFLKEVSISAVLTSKRISTVSKEQHLKKRRKILRILLGN